MEDRVGYILRESAADIIMTVSFRESYTNNLDVSLSKLDTYIGLNA